MSERRIAITEALNTAIDIFTSHSEKAFIDVMSNGLWPIADAVALDRIVFYRRLNMEGEFRFEQIYLWDGVKGGMAPLDEELRILPDIPVLRRWISTLSKGGCVRIRRSDMDQDETELLNVYGVKSILIIPVFSHGQFWGAVAFQDHVNDRYFDEGCADLLFSIARLCANAIIRAEISKSVNDAMDALKRREKMTSTLNRIAVMFLSHSEKTFEDMMNTGIRLIADIADLDRVTIWRNSVMTGGLHASQVFRWDKVSGGTTPTAGLDNLSYSELAPRWEGLLANGDSINSPVRLLPESAMLQAFGIMSAFITPMFINNTFWGFVVFENRREEIYFEEELTEMMRSAAFLCVNTVIRAEMENNIYEANEFNRAMLDSSPVGFTIFNEESQIINCNDAILNLLETDKEYYTNHFFDFSPEYQPDGIKSHDKVFEYIRRVMSGENVVFEWIHCLPSGEQLPFEITLTRAKHNKTYLLLCYQYDLSNIKNMEKVIAEAEELTHAVKEASPLSYVLFNEEMQAIDCNDVILQLLDCPDKSYFLNHYWDFFCPDSQPDGQGSFDKAMSKRDNVYVDGKLTFEWVHRSLGGDLIPMENTMTQVLHRGKKLIISFKYDLRNTKKMMKSIREQSEQLKIRLDQQELISEITRGFISSGNLETYVQEAIAKLGHYHAVSSVIIFSNYYHHGEARPAYYWSSDGVPLRMTKFILSDSVRYSFPESLPDCATVPVISCADPSSGSFDTFHSLLSVHAHAFICAPLYVESRLWGFMFVEHCFTPRHWTDNEKGFVAMTASCIAGIIMRDIYNTKLKKTLHRATVASRAKSEFLSNMSHEMRTPLNAIIGMTAIARNASDIERKDYALNKIDNASAHLLGVINDVLDMSKIEANMMELSPVEFNFEMILQKVASVINYRVDEKKQRFSVHIDRAIPSTLIGDDQRLAQVITNLLGNAVKFTPEGGSITLDTRFIKEEDGLCTVQISVTDTGIGISPEQQKKLFQSFQQAESSMARKFGGTGLGLAISKSIVLMMGGKIWIESESGKGSTFVFTIQAKRGSEKKQSLLAPEISLDKVRILAVDDDPDILEYFKEMTQSIGVFCDTATNGEEALRCVQQNGAYHIYFVDWKMPGMDGVQLAAELKRQDMADSVVIMITAGEWSTIENDAKKSGVDKFLSKPLFPSSLENVIFDALGIDRRQTEEEPEDITGLFAGRRILLAEDVEINREIVLALLEPTQLDIDCAVNGKQAVKMFSEAPQKYDMIFMDVQMPEMDGYEATRRIRALDVPKAKTIPIVAMTANVFREDKEKCLQAGMNSHVGKPLDFDIVVERLRSYLK